MPNPKLKACDRCGKEIMVDHEGSIKGHWIFDGGSYKPCVAPIKEK